MMVVVITVEHKL